MKTSFIFMAALLTVKLLAGDWTVETVATLADSCKGLGFTLDDNNWPHIVYAEKHTDSASVQEKYRDAEGIWQGPYDTNCPHSENMAVYGPWNCVAFDAKNDTFWVITIWLTFKMVESFLPSTNGNEKTSKNDVINITKNLVIFKACFPPFCPFIYPWHNRVWEMMVYCTFNNSY